MARQTRTRERLVTTAGELFWSQGYGQTGVSAIMERAGATSGSFYHFFPTKEELLLAVLDAAGERLETEVLAPAERSAATFAGRLMSVADAYRRRVEAGAASFGLPLGSLAGELGEDHGAARRRLAALYRQLVARMESWLRADAGPLRESGGPRSAAELAVTSLEGAAVVARASGDPTVVDRVAEALCGRRENGQAAAAERLDEPLPPRRGPEGLDWRAW